MRLRCPGLCTRSRARRERGPATQLRRGPDIPRRALCKGFADVTWRGNSLGHEPRNGTEWTMMPAYLRGANTTFLTRRRVNGGADGPWASRAERSPAREAHWRARRLIHETLS